MNPDEFVSQQEFKRALAIQLRLIMELLTMLASVQFVLTAQGLLPHEAVQRARDLVEKNETAVRVRATIEKLQGTVSIEDILKDFEGPIQ